MSSHEEKRPIRRALISVYDKTGLVELAKGLADAGVEIVSTGSTAKTIAANGIPVTPVEELTGFPEVLDGRVKTLHPRVHAGLLADLRKPEHAAALEQLGIAAFELVVVNLYPFSATVESGAGVDECVEQIDIGGPSMVRASAKNHPSVAVVTDPLGYDGVLAAVRSGGFTLAERKKLASLAFRHTAEYDVAVAGWMESTLAPEEPDAAFPEWLAGTWRRSTQLRYGENPHQQAALYVDDSGWPGLAQADQLHGKEMSYNNFTDADAAWRAAFDHEQTCVAIIKHANPCGIAVSSDSVADAHRKAHECDPLSAFGGVIAANTEVSVEMAEYVSTIFTEVIVAPAYAPGAVDVLARKKNVRVLVASEPMDRRHRASSDQRRFAGAAARPDRRARRRPGQLDAGRRSRGRPGHPGRPGLRLANLPRGEIQRDRHRRRRGHHRHRHGSGQPGRRGAVGRRAWWRSRQRRGRRLRRLLPVPGRPGNPDRRGGEGDRASGRFSARRRGDCRSGEGRRDAVPDRRAALRSLAADWAARR